MHTDSRLSSVPFARFSASARIGRRRFLRRSTLSAAGLLLLPSLRSVRGAPANDRLNIGLIGVGGRGRWFVDTMPAMANVIALCDVNDERAGDAYQRIPKAKKYYDFRRMLEDEKSLDGVIIAAPDHIHAVASAMAMRLGRHVYCEKPLTRTLDEARTLARLAARPGVATQMGNQGTASEAFRRAVELIHAGALGEVREVHAWNDAGGRGRHPAPTAGQPIPAGLQWDLWLGPAAERAYHREWTQWHQWRDFATGQLGNWSVHTMNLAFKALRLDTLWSGGPGQDRHVRVLAEVSETVHPTFPRWEKVRWEFPARGSFPPVTVHWHNGRVPGSRPRIEDLLGRPLDWGDTGEKKWKDHAGLLLVGQRGRLHTNGHNTVFTLLPEADWKDFAGPEKTLPRSPGHEREWLDACRGGRPAWSNMAAYGAPLTEFVLLGNVATQVTGQVSYDPVAGRFDSDAANALMRGEYRKGWAL